MYQDIEFTQQNEIGIVSIKRPTVLNAIRLQTYAELIDALHACNSNADIKTLVLTGNAQCFCAGNDLSDLLSNNLTELNTMVAGIFDALIEFKKPLLLAQEGIAVGIGANMMLHADMVFAGKSIRYRLPFANLGVTCEGASSLLLGAQIGDKKARELLLSGRFFSGEEALAWGMLNQLTDDGEALTAALDMAQHLSQQSQDSLLSIKSLLCNEAQKKQLKQVINAEMNAFTELLNTPDTQARIQALLAKTAK